jgi:DNA-binding NarL/FixJ family response regulator
MSKLRVLIAEDHPMMVAAIRNALAAEEDFEIAGEATSGAQVLPLVSHTDPDVVLIDLHLPEVDGLTCLQRIRQKYPEVKVVVLSAIDEPSQIKQALESGACAYITKSIDHGDLAAVIRQAVAGSLFCFGDLKDEGGSNGNTAGLSDREKEVLERVARGLSNRDIAKELWVSDQTVKFHLHNIYRKLNVRNRTEAAKFAHQNGLVRDAAA